MSFFFGFDSDDSHAEGAWDTSVLPALRRVVHATMAAAQPRAEPRADSFEIYGLDLVLDARLRPWLIEANESPDLSAHGCPLKAAIMERMLTDLVEVLVGDGATLGADAPRAAVGEWRILQPEGGEAGRDRAESSVDDHE